jgi:hypothetical protein
MTMDNENTPGSVDAANPAQSNVLTFPRLSAYVCPQCGVDAACDCGAAPITRAQAALLKNPEKSTRTIAMDIGVAPMTVHRARKALGVPRGTPAKVTGRDGKKQAAKKKQPAPVATDTKQAVESPKITIEMTESEYLWILDCLRSRPRPTQAAMKKAHAFFKALQPAKQE